MSMTTDDWERARGLEERSRARLAELEAGREKFIADAQRQIAGLDAAIAEIRALLDPPPPAEQNGTQDVESIPAAAEAATVG